MAKRITFIIVLVLLPIIAFGIDQLIENIRHTSSLTFELWPRIVFTILADIVFTAIVIWLARQMVKSSMPAAAAIIFVILGLAIVCIPLLYLTNLASIAMFLTPFLPDHLTIAGAFLFITGLAGLIWRPKSEAVS